MTKHRAVLVTATLLALFTAVSIARADIFQWEYINPANPSQGKQQSTTLTPDGAGANIVPGVNLVNRNLTMAYLIGANLRPINFFDEHGNLIYQIAADLTGVNLSLADLTGASLAWVTLTGANLTGAEVRGTKFIGGISPLQLYSTASYKAHDLSGIGLDFIDLTLVNLANQSLTNATFFGTTLTNANFSQANLTNANFTRATLTNANFGQANLAGTIFTISGYGVADLTGANLSGANLINTYFAGRIPCAEFSCGEPDPGANLTNANLSGADARGANFEYATLTGANTSNLIQSNGHIAGLDLPAGASLVVRDYDGHPNNYDSDGNPNPLPPVPITVDQHLAMGPGGTLRLVFDADPWDSTISFAPGISVTRGGALELTFASDVNLASQIGRTIDLFDWTGVTPTGAFTISSPYTWNLSNLYTTGEVTLTALAAIPGDFNNNGVVDAADYIVWRKTDGTPTGYNAWRTHFGQPTGSGAAAIGTASDSTSAVPEPASLPLFLLAVMALLTSPRHQVAAKNRC